MSDLVAWLRAQLDDDERVAKAAQNAWLWNDMVDDNGEAFIDRLGIGRWLAEVDAKRRILDLHARDHECSTIRRGVDWDGKAHEEIDNCTWVADGDCSTVHLLAAPYADRPGYRDEWLP